MKWPDRFLCVEDNLPISRVDAIFCPSYCLAKNHYRLTEMNKACVEKVAYFLRRNLGTIAIFSNAYPGLFEAEISFRKTILLEWACMGGKEFHWVGPVSSTYDEVNQLKQVIDSSKIRSLLVVAETYHMKRVLATLQYYMPEVSLNWVSVDCLKFEATAEPSRLKSFRISYGSLWAIWNILGNLAAPLLLRKNKDLLSTP